MQSQYPLFQMHTAVYISVHIPMCIHLKTIYIHPSHAHCIHPSKCTLCNIQNQYPLLQMHTVYMRIHPSKMHQSLCIQSSKCNLCIHIIIISSRSCTLCTVKPEISDATILLLNFVDSKQCGTAHAQSKISTCGKK